MWMCRYEEQLEKFCKLMDFVIDSAPPELRQDFHASMVDRMKDRVDKSAFWGNLLRHVMQQGQKNMVWVLSTDLSPMLMIRTIYTQCTVCKFSSTLSKKNKIVVRREFFDLLLSPASKILNCWFEVESLFPYVLGHFCSSCEATVWLLYCNWQPALNILIPVNNKASYWVLSTTERGFEGDTCNWRSDRYHGKGALNGLSKFFSFPRLLAFHCCVSPLQAGVNTPGSGYVLLHHVMGETGGRRGVWAYASTFNSLRCLSLLFSIKLWKI